jgi:hypothetical protein
MRTQAVEGNGRPQGDALGGGKEARYHADRREDRIEVPHLRCREEQEDEAGTQDVAADHGELERPAIDEDARDDAQNRDRQKVGDLHAGDLRGRRMELERQHADHREENQEIAKHGDDLRDPQATHHGDAQDGAHRHGLRHLRIQRRRGHRWLRRRDSRRGGTVRFRHGHALSTSSEQLGSKMVG